MILSSTQLGGLCSCGRSHSMDTRAAIIERGCLARLEDYLRQYGIEGSVCTVYDENTYRATRGLHPRARQEIILPPNHLHADEKGVEKVLSQLSPEANILIAVGGGTIHDITRYCAWKQGLRFVSVPTAASVDGFCSTVCAMTWYGFKTTMPAVAPEIVVADTQVIAKAPEALVKSGVGDILAKYIALADWEIAHVLTGEYLCRRIYTMMEQAVQATVDSIPGIVAGDPAAFEQVTCGLVMSGLAMQMMGNSRPASGAEHHISHLIEERPAGLSVAFPAMHGEKTGVGALLASKEYHRLAQVEDISALAADHTPPDMDALADFFGPALIGEIQKENAHDCLAPVDRETLIRCWPQIRQIVGRIPDDRWLQGLLEQLSAVHTAEDIGIHADQIPSLLQFSPYVRNRLTLMRIRRMLKTE